MLEIWIKIVAPFVLLVLATPRRYFVNFLGWLAMLVLLILIYESQQPTAMKHGFADALALVFLMSIGAAVILAILLRLLAMGLLDLWRGPPAAPRTTGGAAARPSWMTRVQLACVGGLASILAILFFRAMPHSPWLVHILAFAMTAGLWIVPHFLRRPAPGGFGAPFLAGFRWSFLAGAVAATAMPALVVDEARAVAGDTPFCIQVADQLEGRGVHRPAVTMLDLSGLTMKGGGWREHAVLIVGTEQAQQFFYWSYTEQTFELNKYDYSPPTVAYCTPVIGFAKTLPLLFSRQRGPFTVTLYGRTFRIPDAYRPRSGGEGELTFYTAALSSEGSLEPTDKDFTIDRGIYVAPHPDWSPPLQREPNPEAWTVLQTGEVSSLVRLSIAGKDPPDSGARDPEIEYTRYVERDSSRDNPTRIDCWHPCAHEFVQDGWSFRFRHAESEIADWRKMQRRLIELLDTFTIPHGGADAE